MSGFLLLFDLDGTLVDTDPLHLKAFQEVLAPFDRGIDMATYQRHVMGAANERIGPWLFPDLDAAAQAEQLARKEAIFRASVGRLTPTAGLLDLLDWAERHGVPKGVVTNAPRANAELMLRGLGLAERFDTLVIGDELPRSKPDPLPYRTGVERLGGEAGRAVAFEDSLSGLRSASAAGLLTVAIRTALPDEAVREAGASRVVDDFADTELVALLNDRLKI